MVQILKQDKFSAILTGAGRVFALVGYRRAMMSDIAAEAGVALGTLYRYAASKEELFELALPTEGRGAPRGFGLSNSTIDVRLRARS